MMEELKARFMPRFLDTARKRLARAHEQAQPGNAGAAGSLAGELHALAGEAAVLGLSDVADIARRGEAAARRWQSEPGALAACRDELLMLADRLQALAPPRPQAPPPDLPAAENRRILFVSDDDTLSALVLTRLAAAGFEAQVASGLDPAVRLVRELRPGLVVVHVTSRSPDLDPGALCARAREAAGGSPLRMVLGIDGPTAESIEQAHLAGADGVVSLAGGADAIAARIGALLS